MSDSNKYVVRHKSLSQKGVQEENMPFKYCDNLKSVSVSKTSHPADQLAGWMDVQFIVTCSQNIELDICYRSKVSCRKSLVLHWKILFS